MEEKNEKSIKLTKTLLSSRKSKIKKLFVYYNDQWCHLSCEKKILTSFTVIM